MPNILIIGETYGLKVSKFVDFSKYDRVVFMGNHSTRKVGVSEIAVMSSLVEKTNFCKANPRRATILLGPNDLQYYDGDYSASYDNTHFKQTMNSLFRINKEVFKIAELIDCWLFSYGGITKTWLSQNAEELSQLGLGSSDLNLVEIINLYKHTPFKYNTYEDGLVACPGPLFTNVEALKEDKLDGINQVVCSKLTPKVEADGNPLEKNSIVYVNCLSAPGQFEDPNFLELKTKQNVS